MNGSKAGSKELPAACKAFERFPIDNEVLSHVWIFHDIYNFGLHALEGGKQMQETVEYSEKELITGNYCKCIVFGDISHD